VHDRRLVRVQVHQALEHLPRPPPERGVADVPVLLAVLPQVAAGEELGDEVERVLARVVPFGCLS
jgi:hypothetical protein